MVPAVMLTGLEKLTCCQPLAVSLVKVALASKVPEALQRSPMWVPVFSALVEADADDRAVGRGLELDPEIDRTRVIFRLRWSVSPWG